MLLTYLHMLRAASLIVVFGASLQLFITHSWSSDWLIVVIPGGVAVILIVGLAVHAHREAFDRELENEDSRIMLEDGFH